MIWVFIGISLLFLPTMMNYKAGDAYEDDPRAGFATGMISNMGYSTVQCNSMPVSLGQVTVSCPYGSVGKVLDFGVNNLDSGSPQDACSINDFNRACKPTSNNIANLLAKAVGKERYDVSFS